MADTRRLLELALRGLEAERNRIDQEMTAIRNQLRNGARPRTMARGGGGGQRTLSAAHKRAISEAMKKRWAARKGKGR